MFLALIKAEWIKTMRMLSTYIAFVAAAMLVMLVQFGVYFNAYKDHFYQFLQKNGFDTSLLVNSYVSTRIALEVGFALLIAPMVIQIFARQVAGEDLRGTLRLILSRPISRMALLNAKFIVCAVYCVLLMGFSLALSYGMGLAFYGPHDSITVGKVSEIDDDSFAEEAKKKVAAEMAKQAKLPPEQRLDPRQMERKLRIELRDVALMNRVISNREGMRRMVIVWGFTSWALLTIGSIAFFYSVINKHSIAAMALTIGTFFLVRILQEMANAENIIPLFKALKPYLFTTAMDFWRECMSQTIHWDVVWHQASLLGSYTLGFFVVSQLIFWRKDITS